MKEVLIVIFYTILLSSLVCKLPWFQFSSISKFKMLGLFFLKIFAGLLYVYFSKNLIEAGDIFLYYQDSMIIYQHLIDGELSTFIQLTFGLNNTVLSANIAPSVKAMGFWYDTSAYMMVRFNAIVNVLTFGSGVYANAVFFGFISFLASFILAKLFYKVLPTQDNLVFYSIFLTPSLWYWTSGMHKESITVFLLAGVLSFFLKFMEHKKWHFLLLLVCSFFLLFFTRFFVSIMLLPPILAYALYSYYNKVRPLLMFGGIFLLILVGSYLVPLIFQTSNLVDAVIAKKELYEALEGGNTAIDLGEYDKSYLGIALKVPQAFFNTLVRPHFFDIKTFFLAFASVESFFISISFLVSLFYIKYLEQSKRAYVFLFFGFAFSYLLLTGLIVPNLGAILRYRSVALFVLIPTVVVLWKQKDVFE